MLTPEQRMRVVSTTHLLAPSVIDRMWDGIEREWSRLRSDVAVDVALVVPREAYATDPDEVLEAREREAAPGPPGPFALAPDTRDPRLGLRPVVPIQTGFVADRPW